MDTFLVSTTQLDTHDAGNPQHYPVSGETPLKVVRSVTFLYPPLTAPRGLEVCSLFTHPLTQGCTRDFSKGPGASL